MKCFGITNLNDIGLNTDHGDSHTEQVNYVKETTGDLLCDQDSRVTALGVQFLGVIPVLDGSYNVGFIHCTQLEFNFVHGIVRWVL
jgi:hypothetical protein